MSNAHEVIDDISSLGKALKTIGSQWSNGKREFCGPDWGSELSPCRVCRKGCISQSLKRILAFVPWFHSTKGPWSRNVNGCFCGLGTFNWVVHIHTYFWKWCLIYAQGKILSCLPLMNWLRAWELREQAKICCLEYSSYFYPPFFPCVLAVTITTEHSLDAAL